MTKRLLIGLLAICLGAVNLTGCTSGGSKDDAEVAESNDQQFAEEGEGDFADDESSGGDSTEQASGDEADGGDQAATDEAPVEDKGDDLDLGDEEAPKDELAADAGQEQNPEDDLSLDEPKTDTAEEPKMDEPSTEVAQEPPPPTDEPVFDEPAKEEPKTEIADNEPPPAKNTTESAPVDSYSAPAAPVAYAPMLKIKDAAFTAGDGTTLNRVYVARPKDNWKSVSKKVYGDEKRVADLKKWNPYVRANGVSVGKKIYYSSPSNPSDGRMLTYYEEQNVPPQVYTSQPGDNIRKVSKNLLGFNDAWREVWATNMNVESKGDLPAGTELRYWPESAAPTQTLAANTPPTTGATGATGAPPTEPALPDMAPQPPPDAMIPPPDIPPTDTAGTQPTIPPDTGADPLAPPPPVEDPSATGTTTGAVPPPDTNVPPPPPPVDAAPKPIKKAPPVADASMDGGMDADTTMIIGLGGILLIAAAILFVVIRKNRAKRMDLGQTQV